MYYFVVSFTFQRLIFAYLHALRALAHVLFYFYSIDKTQETTFGSQLPAFHANFSNVPFRFLHQHGGPPYGAITNASNAIRQ